MAPPKGATTPYFAFVNANRAAAKAALLEAGAPAGMGDVGKELGARWRALSDEEKKVRAPRAMRGADAAAVRSRAGICGALVSLCAHACVHERADGPRDGASLQVYFDQVAAAKEAVRPAAPRAERSFRSPSFWRQRATRAPRRPRAHAARPAAQAKEAAGEEDAGAAYAPRNAAHTTRGGGACACAAAAHSVSATRRREAPEEDAGPVTLPLARVKRIIRLDPDVKQTQLDAVRLISRATVRARDDGRSARAAGVRRSSVLRRTPAGLAYAKLTALGLWCLQELFVESLTAGAYGIMKGTKRKTIKFSDIGARASAPARSAATRLLGLMRWHCSDCVSRDAAEQHVMRRNKLKFMHGAPLRDVDAVWVVAMACAEFPACRAHRRHRHSVCQDKRQGWRRQRRGARSGRGG